MVLILPLIALDGKATTPSTRLVRPIACPVAIEKPASLLHAEGRAIVRRPLFSSRGAFPSRRLLR